MSVDRSEVGVGKSAPASRGTGPTAFCSGSHPKDAREKLLKVESSVTVLKPTQVGETSSLRRSGERWLRNSAKWPRNFGRRGALGGDELLGVSVNRLWRLFIKNTGLCSTRKRMYRV